MPAVLRWKGYKFFFYSNEGDPSEPLHVHVRKGTSVAKFWLEPAMDLAEAYGMKPHELNSLQKMVEDNAEAIKRAWHRYFGG
jgi:hypothetical protein